MSLVVPFHGFELELHQQVYQPAEDTELLLRTLALLEVKEGDRACDLGTGTGIAALALAKRGAEMVALDVNPHAVRLARRNAARNGLGDRIAVLQGSLLAPLRGPFDLIAFNPPYLPVAGESGAPLAQAWEGGAGGIGWAPLFLAGMHRCLAPGGRAVVLLSSLGAPARFRALAEERGFEAEALASEKLPWETLEALQVQRANF